MLMQSNLRILKLQAQNAQKSRNEGIRAACPASHWMLSARCWPQHRGSQPRRPTGPSHSAHSLVEARLL